MTTLLCLLWWCQLIRRQRTKTLRSGSMLPQGAYCGMSHSSSKVFRGDGVGQVNREKSRLFACALECKRSTFVSGGLLRRRLEVPLLRGSLLESVGRDIELPSAILAGLRFFLPIRTGCGLIPLVAVCREELLQHRLGRKALVERGAVRWVQGGCVGQLVGFHQLLRVLPDLGSVRLEGEPEADEVGLEQVDANVRAVESFEPVPRVRSPEAESSHKNTSASPLDLDRMGRLPDPDGRSSIVDNSKARSCRCWCLWPDE
jgi:hypothetical protein